MNFVASFAKNFVTHRRWHLRDGGGGIERRHQQQRQHEIETKIILIWQDICCRRRLGLQYEAQFGGDERVVEEGRIGRWGCPCIDQKTRYVRSGGCMSRKFISVYIHSVVH